MILLMCIFLHCMTAGILTAVCVQYGIGVDKYYGMPNSNIGAITIGIFWPVTAPFLFGLFIVKRHKEINMEKEK